VPSLGVGLAGWGVVGVVPVRGSASRAVMVAGWVGEGRPDAGLVLFGPVQDLDVRGVEQAGDQVGGGLVELAGQVGQLVEQGRVLVGDGGG
jgi:hypothetical protein